MGWVHLRCAIAYLFVLLTAAPAAYAQPAAEQPGDRLAPSVQRMLDDDLLTDAQRRELMIFHGQWEGLGELSAVERVYLALLRYEIENETLLTLTDDMNPFDLWVDGVLHLMEADLRAGRHGEVIGITHAGHGDLERTPSLRLMLARAYEGAGRAADAAETLAPLRDTARDDRASLATAADLTAAAEAIVMLARLEGRPAADFHLANELLGQAREEADPLYWPAYVAEARLLFEHGNPSQAIEAVSQALALNPKSSEAWYLLGTMMTRFFNFDAANRAAEKLYAINPHHPLGDALSAQIALRQKDIPAARAAVDRGLERYPEMRLLLALDAATHALSYDEEATGLALTAFDTLAPGNPLAVFHVGRTLADARQYALAEPYLQEAIARQPGWSQPQLELGQLYMQWGDLERAATQLQTAASLDPFHKDITNTLQLVQEMLGYETIETERFIVRFRTGIDGVLARDMARQLEAMADVFVERFGHTPAVKTQVDLMPDDEHFAVRVTGMPDIWTIAACTGDVIAMTPPRPGPKRAFGTFDWLNVMRHEYTHTVNLGQTHNRVPHWFTEGCAVNMETTGRRWSQVQLLAECYNNDKLFAFDELNWGFIRPTEDYHRPLAYAQSAWMMAYIEEAFGWDKAVTLLDHFAQGVGEREAMRDTFGMPIDAFMAGFHAWAGTQVEAWGMSDYGKPAAADPRLAQLLEWLSVRALDDPELVALIEAYRAKPDVLRAVAARAVNGDDPAAAVAALTAYRDARPADPWTHRHLTRLAILDGRAEDAAESMAYLDRIEGDAPEYAVELARVYRASEDFEKALYYAERAVLREPYNPTFREGAATAAIQAGDWGLGAFHIEALALLEPQRSIHQKRLAAVYGRLGREAEAAAARERAEALELLE
jgi:tetratricopeptide (TPR) repeat protein